MFQKVLVAVDLSAKDGSRKILETAARLAESRGGELRLIYVRFMVEGAARYIAPETLESDEREAIAELEKLAASAGFPAERMSAVSPAGRPYAEILAAAAEFQADLIVVGPHSPSMARFLLGSDAQRIVQHAATSVLVVR